MTHTSHVPRQAGQPPKLIPPDHHKLSAASLWQRCHGVLQHLKKITKAPEHAEAAKREQKQRLALFCVSLCGPLNASGEIQRWRRLIQRISIIEQEVAAAARA